MMPATVGERPLRPEPRQAARMAVCNTGQLAAAAAVTGSMQCAG